MFCGLAGIIDQTGLPDSETTDMTDTTDNSLIADFTQVVSVAVGKDRAERRRQKIRRELVQQYFASEQEDSNSLPARVKKLFGLG